MTKKTFKRIIAVVTDSVGIGAAPDAAKFGDSGADTYGHISAHMGPDWQLPNMLSLGLGNIRADSEMPYLKPVAHPKAAYGKMYEISAGKDSMDGHWEMMGLPVTEPLGFFPDGFPQELLDQITEFSGASASSTSHTPGPMSSTTTGTSSWQPAT